LIGNQKTEGNCFVKACTAILAEILHPVSPEVNLGQEDLRENEGEIIERGEKEKSL